MSLTWSWSITKSFHKGILYKLDLCVLTRLDVCGLFDVLSTPPTTVLKLKALYTPENIHCFATTSRLIFAKRIFYRFKMNILFQRKELARVISNSRYFPSRSHPEKFIKIPKACDGVGDLDVKPSRHRARIRGSRRAVVIHPLLAPLERTSVDTRLWFPVFESILVSEWLLLSNEIIKNVHYVCIQGVYNDFF